MGCRAVLSLGLSVRRSLLSLLAVALSLVYSMGRVCGRVFRVLLVLSSRSALLLFDLFLVVSVWFGLVWFFVFFFHFCFSLSSFFSLCSRSCLLTGH